jgi:NFACT protein C-terminal domain
LKDFIAAPKSNDIISDAVAVCAPWSALSRYKYKMKLTPGSTKKGKAARAIVGGFLSRPVDEQGGDMKISPREKELLMSLKGMCYCRCC